MLRPWRHIERRKSRQIMVGKVPVGGDAPISVQSMTNTPTPDVAATVGQIRQLEEAGATFSGLKERDCSAVDLGPLTFLLPRKT